MKHYRIFVLAALAAAAASCSVKEDSLSSSRAIRFTTNLGAYATKATDTNFEQGDAVSLFAEAPINELNVKMTFNGDNLVPEKAIFWPENMDAGQHVNFFAVYPYRTDWEDYSNLSVFSVNADQRTHELYTASDLLGASYMAYPDCETVPLNFTHRLSKLECYINVPEGEVVKDVYLADVYGKVRLSLRSAMDVSTVGEKGTVRMGKVENQWKEILFTAVVPPQEMSFKVLVVTESGRQYTFVRNRYSDASYMESARIYHLSLNLGETDPSTEFDVAVSDWTADNDVQFGKYVADEFQNEGYWSLVTTSEDGSEVYTDMAYVDAGMVDIGIDAGDNTMYRIKYEVGRREKYYGIGKSEIAPGTYTLVENGSAFRYGGNVPLTLRYDLYGKVLTVTEDKDVWSVIGSFDNWTGDVDMTRVSHGVYTIDLDYWNEEFKFRCNHSWDVNIGNYDDEVLAHQEVETMNYLTLPDGLNFKINEPGIYRLTLNVVRQLLHVSKIGESSVKGIEEFVGNWSYALSDTQAISIGIVQNGANLEITYDGEETCIAEYNRTDKSFSVKFQKMSEWTHQSYGLVYDYFWGFVKDGEGIYGVADTVLYYGSLNGDVLEITPGLYNGNYFTSFKIIGLLLEGDYAGKYFDFYGDMPLPQVWTRVNN